MPHHLRARDARAIVAVVMVIVMAACTTSTQPPVSEETDQAQDPIDGAQAMRQFPQNRAPRPELDWSILKREPFSTQLGRWEESVAAEKVCLAGTDQERCRLMLRALDRVDSVDEIRKTMDQLNTSIPVMQSVWADEFARVGKTFVAPTVLYYGVDWQNIEGVIPPDRLTGRRDCEKPFENAVYCLSSRTIYLDLIWLTRVSAAVRDTNGTGGRLGALAVAGHELGHAVHVQTGDAHGDRPKQELLADCFAGAVMAALRREETEVGHSKAARLLYGQEALTEGQLGIALIQGPFAAGPYQPGPVRADFFTGGFNLGFGSCAKRFTNPLE
jgi:hypothetical protein